VYSFAVTSRAYEDRISPFGSRYQFATSARSFSDRETPRPAARSLRAPELATRPHRRCPRACSLSHTRACSSERVRKIGKSSVSRAVTAAWSAEPSRMAFYPLVCGKTGVGADRNGEMKFWVRRDPGVLMPLVKKSLPSGRVTTGQDVGCSVHFPNLSLGIPVSVPVEGTRFLSGN